MNLRDTIRLARPSHWIKNVIVLSPVVLALRVDSGQAWVRAALAAVAMCFAASAIYALNDICDRERDRLHPRKKDRPLAAGRMTVGAALVEAGVFLAAAVGLACVLGAGLLAVVLAYVLLQGAYCGLFRKIIILDVICIAVGFVLRATAGAVAIHAEVSPWLFIGTFTICLFMGFCKRYNEIAALGGAAQAGGHRPTLAGYTRDLATHLITLSAAIAVISFVSYAMSDRTVANFQTHYLVYTLPAFIYAVFRFAMVSMRGCYTDPTDVILHDRPFQLTAAVWAVGALAAIFWGPAIRAWLAAHY